VTGASCQALCEPQNEVFVWKIKVAVCPGPSRSNCWIALSDKLLSSRKGQAKGKQTSFKMIDLWVCYMLFVS